MMKRTVIAVLPLLAASAAMGQQIRATINGNPVAFTDVQPMELNGRVMVPVRGIFEQMGVDVGWEPSTQTVYADGNGKHVVMYIGKSVAQINGNDVNLDVPPTTYMGRTMVPLRFISESMGAEVNWQPATDTVAITTAAMAEHYYGNNQTRQYANNRTRDYRYRQARSGQETSGYRAQPINTAVLRANTVIPVTLNTALSSRDSEVGQPFTATVNVNGNDYMGIPAGTVVEGHVSSVRPMDNDNPGVLGLAFDRLRFPDGTTAPIDGSLIGLDDKSVRNTNGEIISRKSDNKNTKYVGIGAGAGALLGVATKNNVITTAVIGAALGYLYGQSQVPSRKDVMLHSGETFGVVLNQDERIPVSG